MRYDERSNKRKQENPMKEIQTSGEYKIYEKRSGRYAVKDASRKYVNGDDKARILADAGLVALPKSKPKPVEDSPSENEITDEDAESPEVKEGEEAS